MKKAEYMLGYVGEEFDGVISGVTSFGMFVELANGVEGLVHISSLTDDYYEYDEQGFRLVGNHTGKIYRLGDPLRIEVLRVNMEDRSIDFIRAGENEAIREYIRGQLERRGGKTPKADGSHARLQAEIRRDAREAAGAGSQERSRKTGRHGSHKGEGGRKKPYGKRGKGGVGGNKYAADPVKKKKKRRRR